MEAESGGNVLMSAAQTLPAQPDSLVEHIYNILYSASAGAQRVTCAMPAQAWKQVLNAIHYVLSTRQDVKDDKGTVF